MNTVILTSVLSAGNHALYAGTRVLYGLSVARHGPRMFVWTTQSGVPLPALLATSSISLLCFGSSFIGSGQLWGWLQNIVGVSNQVWFWPFAGQLKPVHVSTYCRLHGFPLDLRVGDSERLGSCRVEGWTS
jgi:amino acid permease